MTFVPKSTFTAKLIVLLSLVASLVLAARNGIDLYNEIRIGNIIFLYLTIAQSILCIYVLRDIHEYERKYGKHEDKTSSVVTEFADGAGVSYEDIMLDPAYVYGSGVYEPESEDSDT